MTSVLPAALLAATIAAAAALPALAQGGGCYSDAQIRAAVQSGQVRPLSAFLSSLQARYGGQVTGNPQLCQGPGGLAYFVTLIVRGRVMQVTVNAQTGAVQ